MTEKEKFKWDVYARVAYSFNKNRLRHSAMHGVDYKNCKVGRDCDILIHKQDARQAQTMIEEVFASFGGFYKVISWAWGSWFFLYLLKDGMRYTVEIDIAWTYKYRLMELTDLSCLGYHTDKEKMEQFYIDPWNQFAKVFLLRFLSADFSKFDNRRIEEVKDIANSLSAPYTILSQYMPLWVDACRQFDVSELKSLRRQFKMAVYFIKHPLSSIKEMVFVCYFALMRAFQAYYVIPSLKLVVRGTEEKHVMEEISRCVEDTFITKLVIYRCGTRLSYYRNWFKARFHTSPFSLPVFIMPEAYSPDAVLTGAVSDYNHFMNSYFQSIFLYPKC